MAWVFRHLPGSVIALVVAGVVSYFGSQIAVTKELGERPTRQEMEKKDREIREDIQQQLNDIKNGQSQMFQTIQELNKNVMDGLK